MKVFALVLFLVLGFAEAYAEDSQSYEDYRTSYETGTGREYETCRVPSSFCVDSLKRRAEYSARQDAERRCQLRRGRVSGMPSCSTLCSPSLIPPNAPPTRVICDSRCTVRCEVQ